MNESVPVVKTHDNKKPLSFNHSFSDLKTEGHSVTLQRMRWFYAVALFIWTFASIVVPSLIFYLTKSPLALSLFSTLAPPIFLWYRFSKHLFPMDERTFELKKLKILAKAIKKHGKN